MQQLNKNGSFLAGEVCIIEFLLILVFSGISIAAHAVSWPLLFGVIGFTGNSPQFTAAFFSDGNGSSLPDQYPGIAGAGWSDGWQSVGVAATVTSGSPVNLGGNYLSVSALEGGDGLGRAFSNFGSDGSGIDTGSPYDIQFDYRIDVMPDIGQLNNINGRLQIIGSYAMNPNTDSSNSFFIFAGSGLAGNGAGTTPVWQFYNGRKNGTWNSSCVVNSGMKVYVGNVYHFMIGMEPADREYSVMIDDLDDAAGPVYLAGLGFRRSTFLTKPYTIFSVQTGTTGTGQISIDNFKISRRSAGSAQITVDGNTGIRTIPMTMYGGNLTCWSGNQDGNDPVFNKLMVVSGRKNLRWPGGSWGNCHLWRDMEGPNNASSWIVSYNETLNQLFPALSDSGNETPPTLQPIVNFPGVWYGTQHTHQEAVNEAAAWVRDQTNRSVTALYWEIGNEIGGSWECGWFPEINGTYYGDYFADFYLAMKAVNPNIKIGFHGNASGVPGWTYDTLIAAAKKGVVPDFIIIHTYPGGSAAADNTALLADHVDYIAEYTSILNHSVSSALGTSYVGKIGYYMTEWDANPGGEAYNRSQCYVNAMFHVQYILEMAKHKWEGSNAWAQWEFGPNYFAYPVWYIHPILINYFGRDMVTASSSNSLVRSYAAKDAQGNMTMLIVNNSPVDTVPVQINISGFAAAPIAQQWLMEPAGNIITGGINNQDMDNIRINGVIHPDPMMVRTLIPQKISGGNQLTLELTPSAIILLKIPSQTADIIPPATVSGVTTTMKSLSVLLNWDASNEPDLKGYVVYRSEVSGEDFKRLNTDLLTTPYYIDSQVTDGTVYYYVITAVDESLNESPYSREQAIHFPKTTVGFVLREYWTDMTGSSVADLVSNPNYPDKPAGSEKLRSLEGPTNWKESYGSRCRGYLHPLTTGQYNFWIAADDRAELWLSDNGNPASRVRIAKVPSYTGIRQWDKYPEQKSSAVTLAADRKYYIEVLHKEGSGGDHLSVAWSGPGISRQIIEGIYLSPWQNGLAGDLTDDETVNLEDVCALAPLWLEANCFNTAGTDMDGNCWVDYYEFSQLAANWMNLYP